MAHISRYYDTDYIKERVRQGTHRGVVGGMWDEIGELQFNYVKEHGLTPNMRFLDVGCGCLRGGLHFINYLDTGCYYGIDLSQELMDAGYNTELSQVGLQGKLPRKNLHCTGVFDADHFGVSFDKALALSVFTHLSLNHIKLCLTRLAEVMKPGGQFFATIFNSPRDHDWSQRLLHTPGNVTTYPDRDPFHYHLDDLKLCCRGLPWELQRLESWNHPRDQWMAIFVRIDSTT